MRGNYGVEYIGDKPWFLMVDATWSFTRDAALGSFPKEHRLIQAHEGKQLAVQCRTLLGRWWQISLP